MDELQKRLDYIDGEISRFTGGDIARIQAKCDNGMLKGRAIVRIKKLSNNKYNGCFQKSVMDTIENEKLIEKIHGGT